ncbi:assimilatory nitrate reductase large subunit [Sphingobium fuliginis]|uniref:Assimilatory nitrate reductase large subunit n=1 Tax=Sphingobium fuliginis (strain ATCC 27551) TaxID=336203 RepID=A0A292ZH67_SPHSA|nr:assimilatory nitrate reductase large subunit [Sphingobium fuliginis]
MRADRDHPLSQGHACFKGLQAPATHYSPQRILTALKRTGDGSFSPIAVADALDEIAEKLGRIRDAWGPDAIATYRGGPSFYNFTAGPMMAAFREALGTRSHYTTATIDQPGKRVAAERMGFWHAGKVGVEQADVLMLVGTNPMVSFQTVGCFANDPVKSLKRARVRGMKLIVIDPRLTETARQADVFIQALPGEDTTVLACFLRELLERDLVDAAFCANHVAPGHMAGLREAVAPFTLDYTAKRAQVDPAALVAGVELLGGIARGSVFSGTGPSMGAQPSLAEHLVECINIIGGRYLREGDPITNALPWLPRAEKYAQPVGPTRAWEKLPPSRFRGVDFLRGERLTSNLPDAIEEPGEGQVRALINDGGNIAGLVPDQRRVVRALRNLDLLVSIDPFMTATSRLSNYIFAPKLQYERDDMPFTYPGSSLITHSWAQYLPAIATPPVDAEVVDDHLVFWGLAKRLGLSLVYCGEPLDMMHPPSTERLIELGTAKGVVPFEQIKQFPPGGRLLVMNQSVQPSNADAGQFEPMPDDVAAELAATYREWRPGSPSARGKFTHRLAARRSKEMMNNQGLYVDTVRSRAPFNPVFMNGEDIAELGLSDGDRVMVVSSRDRVEAMLRRDDTLMRGVVTLAHGWGGLPDDPDEYDRLGACANRLLDSDHGVDLHTALAVMSGVPVYLERATPT